LNLSRGSYKTYARRRRPGTYDDDDPEELGDLSDEEEESIDHKLARIRREVEQLKVSAEEKVSTATKGSHSKSRGEDENILDGIEKISDALEAVYNDRHGGPKSAETELSRTISMFSRPNQTAKEPAETSNELQPSSTHSQVSQILSKAADFDERLTALETSLGLSGRNMPDSASDIIKPILPSLKSLERSIQLATAQSGTLDLAQSKMRQLLKDAERLNRARSEEHSNANGDGEKSSQINTEQASKINALYGLLPTIDTMSPTLPLVLDRLRTLQLLHTNAADASATLDEMEKRQDDQEEEIKTWRQALEKVEENLKENETTLAENMEKMGSWVRELESKASKYT
jgi:nuclear migration protein JNM1